jgi:hypothetical protein
MDLKSRSKAWKITHSTTKDLGRGNMKAYEGRTTQPLRRALRKIIPAVMLNSRSILGLPLASMRKVAPSAKEFFSRNQLFCQHRCYPHARNKCFLAPGLGGLALEGRALG